MKRLGKKWQSILLSVLVLIIGAFIVGYIVSKSINDYYFNPNINDQSQTEYRQESEDSLFEGRLYVDVKQDLMQQGWELRATTDFESADDTSFPEIGNCGNGYDAVCFVDFKKDNDFMHLTVQNGGRKPYGPYDVWTVVGVYLYTHKQEEVTATMSSGGASLNDCAKLGLDYDAQFQAEQKARGIFIDSFAVSKTHYNNKLNACLSQVGVMYDDHGGKSEDRLVVNLISKEIILKGSDAVAYINSDGSYYIDPAKAGVITDLVEFDAKASVLMTQ